MQVQQETKAVHYTYTLTLTDYQSSKTERNSKMLDYRWELSLIQ